MPDDKSETTPSMVSVIAAKLTPNQRKALLWLPEDGSQREQDETPHLGTGLFGIASKAIGQDIAAHLATYRNDMRMIAPGKWAPNRWRATKLGLQVRKVLCNG